MPYDESSLDCSEEVGHEVVGGNERILLVEEDDAIRNLTSKFLVTLGYRVEHLGSPSEALESIRETPFDLLISEIHLPGMDGREFASECRMTQPALRTILVSGDTSSRESSTNLIGETHSFLPKPFTTTQLAKRIREALD